MKLAVSRVKKAIAVKELRGLVTSKHKLVTENITGIKRRCSQSKQEVSKRISLLLYSYPSYYRN